MLAASTRLVSIHSCHRSRLSLRVAVDRYLTDVVQPTQKGTDERGARPSPHSYACAAEKQSGTLTLIPSSLSIWVASKPSTVSGHLDYHVGRNFTYSRPSRSMSSCWGWLPLRPKPDRVTIYRLPPMCLFENRRSPSFAISEGSVVYTVRKSEGGPLCESPQGSHPYR